jgi:serine/threonine-protein kinase
MAIEAGQQLLHYRLIEKIGEGGMGAVWRATDTSLNRDVAIKVLPEQVAVDPERRARFEREARLLATLNHPNIATVYGFHQSDGTSFLAMELVVGEDLAQRIDRGPLPADQAVEIAHQIAEAFEVAHESGIIHRDLKPANVRITSDGKVKVLDFGLAKGLEVAAPDSDPQSSPTVTSLGTVAGVILGTAAYMSPEQARGHAADRRSDVWSFGALLYEMLSGNRPFDGGTASDTLAAVLAAWPRTRAGACNRSPRRGPGSRMPGSFPKTMPHRPHPPGHPPPLARPG